MKIRSISLIMAGCILALGMAIPVWAQDKNDAVYQKVTREYTLNKDGSYDMHYHKELQLLTYYAFQRRFGETFIIYNPESQELEINYSYTIMADGRKITAPDNAFNEVLPRFAAEVPGYNHLREMGVAHTGLEKGAVIFLDYTIHTDGKLLPFFMGDLKIGEPVPVDEMYIIIKTPEDIPLNYKAFNTRTGPQTEREEGMTVYSWLFRSLPAIPAEQYTDHSKIPLLSWSIARNMTMAYFSFVNQEAFKQQLGPEITVAVDQVAAGKENDLDIILALQEMVAGDIRNKSIPLYCTGVEVRTAGRVWSSGYGSGLEKSILLARMLAHAGIKAIPVAVMPASLYDDRMGDILLFKDFMVQANPKKYDRMYLSSTKTDDRNALFNMDDKAVIGLDPNVETLRVIREKPARNSMVMEGTWTINDTASVSGSYNIEMTDYGNPYFKLTRDSTAVNKLLTSTSFTGKPRALTTHEATGRKLKAALGSELQDAEASYEGYYIYELPAFAKGIDSWHLGSMSDSRETPMKLPFPLQEEYVFTVKAPSGFTLVNDLAAVAVKNSIGTVTISIARDKDQYTVTRKIEISQTGIGPEVYGDLRQLLDSWYEGRLRKLVFKVSD